MKHTENTYVAIEGKLNWKETSWFPTNYFDICISTVCKCTPINIKNHSLNITILSRDLMRKTRSRGWWSHNTKSLSSTSHDLDTQRSCTKLFYFIFSLSNFIQDFLLILFFVNCFYLFFNLDLSIILCFISKLFLWLTKWVLRNKNLNSYPSLNHGTTDE
jgi:hypothetical protein